ncbi:MAG: DUF6159 family protein [Chloroflexota bacterium]
MFEKLSNSWALVKASWRVLMADKELMIFPIVSFFASIIVIATFAVPTILAGVLDGMFTGDSQILSYIVLFLFYVVLYTATIFSNSALVGAALIRLKGGDPTVGDGFRIALGHIRQIFGYAVISATVGLVLRMISERSGALGQFVVSLVGFVWGIATFLVVPILVVEDVGPMEAVKRSAQLLKETWGEQIAGNFSIGLIFGVLTFIAFLIGLPLIIVAASTSNTALIITAVVVMVIVFMALALISSTLSGIYTAAIYRYATTGDVGTYFEADLVKGAFKQK